MRAEGVRWGRLGRGLLGVAASTVLLALYARVEVPWVALGWVALVPWLAVLDRASSLREALGAGLALSVGFTLAVFSWFARALQDYTQAPLLGCWLAVAVLAPLLEPQFLALAAARYLAGRTGTQGALSLVRTALAGSLVYVGTEWAWPKLLGDTLGHGLHASVYLRQGADLAGAHGLTLVLLLANECVLRLSSHPWERARLRHALKPLAALCALVLSCLGYGSARYHQVQARLLREQELVVGVVQANLTHYDRLAAELGGTYEVVRQVLDTHYALSRELLREERLDLLVWPETIYPTTFGSPKSEEGAELDGEISGFVSAHEVPLIFGAYDAEPGGEYNAAFLLGPAGQGRLERAAYRKSLLFPLTEWVPEALDSPRLREWLPWAGSWRRGPGPRAVALRLRGERRLWLAPLICYEALSTAHAAQAARQGAQLIVNLSNDSWFSGTPGPRLHLVVAAFRSIETRLPQVRATNSGISAIIDATGGVTAETPVDARAVLAGRVLWVERLPTLVVAWGEWLGPLALAVGLGLAVGTRWRALSSR